METTRAEIKRADSKTALILYVADKILEIVLTEDNPNNIKGVFNGIIRKLKSGLIQFELADEEKDLFHHISTEYINLLNAEMKSVYDELKDYGLLEHTSNAV
jgi:hypothetical protein